MGLTPGLPRESKLRKVIRNKTGSHRDWQEASKELSLLPIVVDLLRTGHTLVI